MNQTFTIILNNEERIHPDDVLDKLDEEWDVVSVSPAPTTTLQQPPPTNENQPS